MVLYTNGHISKKWKEYELDFCIKLKLKECSLKWYQKTILPKMSLVPCIVGVHHIWSCVPWLPGKQAILRSPSTREQLYGFNAAGNCLVRACLLHCMHVWLRNGYTQAYVQIMQHTYTHKAVTGRVEAKKLLSRRRQSNYKSLVIAGSPVVLSEPNWILRFSRPKKKKNFFFLKFSSSLHHSPSSYSFWILWKQDMVTTALLLFIYLCFWDW